MQINIFASFVMLSLSVQANLLLKLSEFNMLYHFDDLSSKQFIYLFSEWLSWENRLPNNIETLNELFGDITCVVEWNGNPLNRFEIDSYEKLAEKFWVAFVDMGLSLIRLTQKLAIKKVDDKEKLLGIIKFFVEEYITQPVDNPENQFSIYLFQLIKKRLVDNVTELEILANKLKSNPKPQPGNEMNPSVDFEIIYFEGDDKKNTFMSVVTNKCSHDPFSKLYDQIENLIKIGVLLNNHFHKDFKSAFSKIPKDKKNDKIILAKDVINQILKDNSFFAIISEDFFTFLKKNGELKKYQSFDDLHEDFKSMLLTRIFTLLHVENLDLFKKDQPKEYKYTITRKKYGRYGQPVPFETYSEGKEMHKMPEPESEDEPMQAILMAHDAKKITAFDGPQVYSVLMNESDSSSTKINTQNFVVQYFKDKIQGFPFGVICAHFKSKDEGADARKRLGKRIRDYINTVRTFPGNERLDFIVMGDFNAEIDEIAMNFNSDIYRIKKEKQESEFTFDAKQKYISNDFEKFTPASFEVNKIKKKIKELRASGKNSEEEIMALEKKCKEVEKGANPSGKFVELYNFNTEAKIRVNEIDFLKAEYIDSLETNLKFIFKGASSLLEGLSEMTEFADHSTGEWKFEAEKYKGNSIQTDQRKTMFAQLIKYLLDQKNELEEIKNKILSSLIDREKIDFILLDFIQDFIRTKKMQKVTDYEKLNRMGIPNKEYSAIILEVLEK